MQKYKSLSVKVPHELWLDFKISCAKSDITMNMFLTNMIKEKAAQFKKKTGKAGA